MNTIELMLEASKLAVAVLKGYPQSMAREDALITLRNAIAAGEAELKREPDASLQLVANLLSEYGLQALDVVAAFKTQEPVAWICKPHGLMFDAMGDPRTRYVRVTLNGSHCVMSPTEGDNYVQDAKESGDDSDYIVTDVYLSEREFDDLPEHDGF